MNIHPSKILLKKDIVYDTTRSIDIEGVNVDIRTVILREEYNIAYFWRKKHSKEIICTIKQFIPYMEEYNHQVTIYNSILETTAKSEMFNSEVWLHNNKFQIEEKYGTK